jgi:threonine dehydratase
MSGEIRLADIYRARQRLVGAVRRTPLAASETLGSLAEVPVHLKLEHLQTTGSFKLRGATNAVAALDDDQRHAGIVGVSTGNHGRGLAHAAKRAGVRCVICMSELVPQNKIDGIRALGAEVRIVGRSQDDAQIEVDRLVAEEGMTMLPPFDHAAIVAGQGTLGLEIVEDLPELETIIVPLSGGGLISGVALAVKSANADARLIGVTMERGAAMHASLRAGRPIAVEEVASLADSLGGGIGLENVHTFRMVQDLVDEIVLVSEPQIAAGIRHAYKAERQIVEGGAAVGISAILAEKVSLSGPTAIVLSGCNIDVELHKRIITGAWAPNELGATTEAAE